LTSSVARAAARAPATRVLFVNSGILGHRAVAGLLRETLDLVDSVASTHIDLSRDLTIGDRVIRRFFSVPLAPRTGVAGNLDLRRWREELNVGLLAARRIEAAERRGPFDVIHFHTQATAYASLSRMKRTPSIVSIDATQHLASREAHSALGRLTYAPNIAHDGLVFTRASAITATSDWAAADLRAHYPDSAGRVHVMPYPVRVIAEPSWPAERASRRGGPVQALFIGGDFPRKGGPELLQAWGDASFGGKATLDLITDWPVAAGALPPGVRILRGVAPYTPQWVEAWKRADFFVMPTRHEAFGMVFQEAAAAGLPAIATAINAVPEIVTDGKTGLLVAPGDAQALVGALRALVESPDLRVRLGAAALDRIRVTGDPRRYAAKLETIIYSVLNDARRAN
jgi:glycosyltransferase involved in cell wall biosynthesis